MLNVSAKIKLKLKVCVRQLLFLAVEDSYFGKLGSNNIHCYSYYGSNDSSSIKPPIYSLLEITSDQCMYVSASFTVPGPLFHSNTLLRTI
jgi:hypothetical protein